MKTVGILMLGGSGSRLKPVSNFVNKHLFHVHNKPMFYYSLSVLLLAKIDDLRVVVNASEEQLWAEILKSVLIDNTVKLTIVPQDEPDGVLGAFERVRLQLLSENIFYARMCVILGDNFFWGSGFGLRIDELVNQTEDEFIFTVQHNNPSAFGVLVTNEKGMHQVIEKPEVPQSNSVVTGLYILNVDTRKSVLATKSLRGEFEMAALLNARFAMGSLLVEDLGRAIHWFDLGTFDALSDAASLVRIVERNTMQEIGNLHEIQKR